jgi:predicted RNA-binding protein with RPS1 domain
MSIQDYGAFIQFGNFLKQGLLHISQVTNQKISGKEDILLNNRLHISNLISLTKAYNSNKFLRLVIGYG